MEYTLIANSGIQLFAFRLKINTQDRFKQWFHEWYDTGSGEWKLELVHEVCTEDCTVYYKKATQLGIDLIFLMWYSTSLNIIRRLWKHTRKTVSAAMFFETPFLFHEALRIFFEEDMCHHHDSLRTFLTLKFQSFENTHLHCA